MMIRVPRSALVAFVLLPALAGCARRQDLPAAPASAIDPHYPAHWWEPVDRAKAASWEVLPQDCRPGEVVLSKRNELGLLSNFAATPFVYHGKRFASVEGFWQATLYPEDGDDPRARIPGVSWPHRRSEVEAMAAFEAKRAGEEAARILAKAGIDWVSFERRRMTYRDPGKGAFYGLITEVMWEKVRQNAAVKRVLLATGDLVLKPDHRQEPGAPPAWRYFEIYMGFREKLRSP